jgi:thioesterase domain-containing protein
MCYANMERHFAPDRPVYGVQSCCLFGEGEGSTIEEIATSCRRTIVGQQPEGPYHLFGYCFGGLLAYEVARQLWKDGATVGLVAAFDYPFPDPDPSHSWLKRPTSLLSFARNLALCFKELCSSPMLERRIVRRRLALRLRGLLRGQGWNEALLAGRDSRIGTADEQLYEIHEKAWRQYTARGFPGEVTLLRPRRLPIFRAHDPTLGWSKVTAERLRVRIVPGPGWHGAALQEPFVTQFTRILEFCIAEAEQMPTTPAPCLAPETW